MTSSRQRQNHLISQKERPRLSSTSSRVFSSDCEFDSKPSASTSDSGVFHFDALQLRMHAHVCAEIVFVVVEVTTALGGHRAREREQRQWFPPHRRCRVVPTTPRVVVLGRPRFLARVLCRFSEFVQFCGNVSGGDTAHHFAKTKVFGSIATA